MYCRSTAIGAPPHVATKYDGDHSTFDFDLGVARSGRSTRSRRLDTPFREFTNRATDSFGGYSTNRCTWSHSPLHSIKSESKSAQMLRNDLCNLVNASSSSTRQRYFKTNTRCTYIRDTECLRLRTLDLLIDTRVSSIHGNAAR